MAEDNKTSRSKAQIEADLAAARARLSGNVQTLIGEVHPKSVAQRSLFDAKSFAQTEFKSAQRQVRHDNGEWRWDRVGVLAGAAAGVIAFFAIIGSLSRKGR